MATHAPVTLWLSIHCNVQQGSESSKSIPRALNSTSNGNKARETNAGASWVLPSTFILLRATDLNNGGNLLKKLFTLKKWLTLQETARHLAIVFGEDVCEADVLRLALDGHLVLSVNFVNHAKARQGNVVPIELADFGEFPEDLFPDLSIPEEHKGKPIKYLKGIDLDGKRVLNLSNEVTSLDGVYDLVMLGNERLDIEHAYQMLTDGPSVTLQGLDGAFVTNDASTMYQILENYDENEHLDGSNARLRKIEREIAVNGIKPEKAKILLAKHKKDRQVFLAKQKERRDSGRNSENYYPAGSLPNDSVIVVRTDALRDFEQSVNETPETSEKPLTTTERNTLLTIIAALCDYSAVDPAARGSAGQIAGMTAELGAAVTDDTIRKVLLKIPNAVERRMK